MYEEEIRMLREFIESEILQKFSTRRVGYYWKKRDSLLFSLGAIVGFMAGGALGIVALFILVWSVK
jgi:hypothetical protein